MAGEWAGETGRLGTSAWPALVSAPSALQQPPSQTGFFSQKNKPLTASLHCKCLFLKYRGNADWIKISVRLQALKKHLIQSGIPDGMQICCRAKLMGKQARLQHKRITRPIHQPGIKNSRQQMLFSKEERNNRRPRLAPSSGPHKQGALLALPQKPLLVSSRPLPKVCHLLLHFSQRRYR